jgi:hypothetical protein
MRTTRACCGLSDRRGALRADAGVSLVVLSAPMRINWREVCKFLAGAFFVSAGVLFYLYLTNTPVPLLGTDVVISPKINGMRSIAHFAFFLITFYLGFIRK